MERLNKHKFLLLAILANILFLWRSYVEDGRVHITWIHIVFGLVPLTVSVLKTIERQAKHSH